MAMARTNFVNRLDDRYCAFMSYRHAPGWAVSLMLVALTAGCAHKGSSPASVYQNSTIDALLDGNYDGEMTIADLRRQGDFGLGTFNALDGEMLMLDGVCYQVRSDGRAYVAPPQTMTPLGIVTRFRPDREAVLDQAAGYKALQAQLDALRPNDGHVYAVRIDGRFKAVRTRSVPRQSPPYRRLAEVVKTQPTFDFADVEGTLVGFWFPESMRHVNVPGYHFHFITHTRDAGGHVLDLTFTTGTAKVQQLPSVEIALPEQPPTTQPIWTDRRDELEAVEK